MEFGFSKPDDIVGENEITSQSLMHSQSVFDSVVLSPFVPLQTNVAPYDCYASLILYTSNNIRLSFDRIYIFMYAIKRYCRLHSHNLYNLFYR